jgi:hypothetical protein
VTGRIVIRNGSHAARLLLAASFALAEGTKLVADSDWIVP